MTRQAQARTALAILTALNFLNYIDRSILFAVQPLVQAEFKPSDAQIGFLTTSFLICYMVTAPVFGFLADRFPRKYLMAIGAAAWSLLTLLTFYTYDYTTLLIRHALVGVGEASFVAIAPAFLSDLFPEERRGRILAVFYLAIPVGTALGYLLGGQLGSVYGWRQPFLVAAIPGLLLAGLLLAIPEPVRGARDRLIETDQRGTYRGLLRNPCFWSCSLGMAMMTFAAGGLQAWMPTFLARVRGVPLARANFVFGLITVVAGLLATLLGGWIGDRLLRRNPGAQFLVSGFGMALAFPTMAAAIYIANGAMFPAIFLGEFFLLLNTAPLNAALVNSVGAHVRATAVAVNIFVIHALGDAISPYLIGWISDRSNLQTGFASTLVAVALSAGILFFGMRFAPRVASAAESATG